MDTLLAARAQMEVSLGFHMIFAALGIGLPLLMVIAEGLWLRTGRPHYRALARKWVKATALTFAVGAVSGTALSFELGLLWPRFMAVAGGVVGPAFALEGYAFFVEAIFIGLYLYGWERLSKRAHWWAGVAVAVSGAISGVLVVSANAWMQVPGAFQVVAGRLVATEALAPFRSPAWLDMALHATLSCYVATSFAVAGVYAVGMLRRGRRNRYHRSALGIALAVGVIAAVLQPLSGDISARRVAKTQPPKLAAAESLFRTQTRAPLVIGGLPDVSAQTVRWGIEIPAGLSLLATHDINGEVKGLDVVPPERRPPVMLTHIAFQLMVGIGILGLAALLVFDDLGHALAVPGVYMVVSFLEGNFITPLVLGRRLTLNPVVIFVGLLFWFFLWGIPGALLAVPTLAIFKIVCDHVDTLAPIGEFFGPADD